MNTKVFAVIGRGYGDEGKGLATDYLAGLFEHEKCIVVRHNGGAQSGHTVEKKTGERFVFHELSSGSLSGAHTFWAGSFYPDLYKIEEEALSFKDSFGFIPEIYADTKANITLFFDVMINMAIETKRGASRHGSCGMGINEADLRTKAGFGITVGDVADMDADTLIRKFKSIREDYCLHRLRELGFSEKEIPLEINDDEILEGFVRRIIENLSYITPVEDARKFMSGYDSVIFETGQGLLLDADNEDNLPYVTASKTGLTNIVKLTGEWGLDIEKVIYVTRSYVTKHGPGPLLNECDSKVLGIKDPDKTNVPNEWQGSLRFALYEDAASILDPVLKDLKNCPGCKATLFITHLNETDDSMKAKNGDIPLGDFVRLCGEKGISEVVISRSRFASECVIK